MVLALTRIGTFSILVRIESPATGRRLRTDHPDDSFQYPRSDRIPCNRCGEPPRRVGSRLSVSSFGSNPLQQYTASFGELLISLFQYPRSDRIPCNFTGTFRLAYCASLSVSSFGSNPLQQSSVATSGISVCTFSILVRIESPATMYNSPDGVGVFSFQYPRSDRIPCNRADRDGCDRGSLLSVSSFGSNPLQPLTFNRQAQTVKPFSILVRIESPATGPADDRQGALRVFQYPRSDRIPCNIFIYDVANNGLATFSILVRIESPATCHPRRHQRIRNHTSSPFPGRDEPP